MWPSESTYIPKRTENIHKNWFIAALFIIAKSRNNPNFHQLVDNSPACCIHTMEYHSGKNTEWNVDSYYNMDDPWKHDDKWKKPYTRGHVQGSTYIQCPEYANPKTECRLVIAKGWRKGRMGAVTDNEYKVPFRGELVLELDSDDRWSLTNTLKITKLKNSKRLNFTVYELYLNKKWHRITNNKSRRLLTLLGVGWGSLKGHTGAFSYISSFWVAGIWVSVTLIFTLFSILSK